MIVKSKYKVAKRLGAEVFEKTQTQKFAATAARRKQKMGRRPRSLSDFGRQLLEKQKVRYTYGILEKQFSRYVKEVTKSHSQDPLSELFRKLEMRVDNVVFRLGLAPTRRQARQMVSHGHITVGDKKMTIPSHHVRVGEKVAVKEGSREKSLFTLQADRIKEYNPPKWVKFDAKKLSGEVTQLPVYTTVDNHFDLAQVLEYYSR
ncbi:MAG: 30S ribosomal protein S4 [Candidatus Pacebacteria bacterium]|jgi:small subunit ribosomal protein S4|nr:30S ribosomal protein S4 [bacterium]MDP6527763.1 30S ribosomal protein S4 [Candidatus Paceibacterota bacterium]MDP6659600.1 30S ribosomal protein S4 [Candidatus Paceibacterota bacterium]|tara:strand:- start:32325 stop:32936 length:612 start_codon:yes stop_codon:yes gene_type:complete